MTIVNYSYNTTKTYDGPIAQIQLSIVSDLAGFLSHGWVGYPGKTNQEIKAETAAAYEASGSPSWMYPWHDNPGFKTEYLWRYTTPRSRYSFTVDKERVVIEIPTLVYEHHLAEAEQAIGAAAYFLIQKDGSLLLEKVFVGYETPSPVRNGFVREGEADHPSTIWKGGSLYQRGQARHGVLLLEVIEALRDRISESDFIQIEGVCNDATLYSPPPVNPEEAVKAWYIAVTAREFLSKSRLLEELGGGANFDTYHIEELGKKIIKGLMAQGLKTITGAWLDKALVMVEREGITPYQLSHWGWSNGLPQKEEWSVVPEEEMMRYISLFFTEEEMMRYR